MNNKDMISVIQAFEDGKEVRCEGPNGIDDGGPVTNGHVWNSRHIYHITEQPKTVTFGWFVMPRTRGLTEIKMLVMSGENGVATYFGSGPIKTETIEVTE